jgi:hypothetical protein
MEEYIVIKKDLKVRFCKGRSATQNRAMLQDFKIFFIYINSYVDFNSNKR